MYVCTYGGQRSTSGALFNLTLFPFYVLYIYFWRQAVSLKFKLTYSARLHDNQAPGMLFLPHCTFTHGLQELLLPGFLNVCRGSKLRAWYFQGKHFNNRTVSPARYSTVSNHSPWGTIALDLTIIIQSTMDIHEFLSEHTPSFSWDQCWMAQLLNSTVEVCSNAAVII